VLFDYSDRIKIFSSCASQLTQIGIVVKIVTAQSLREIVKIRLACDASPASLCLSSTSTSKLREVLDLFRASCTSQR
jgi:hypothetical protein